MSQREESPREEMPDEAHTVAPPTDRISKVESYFDETAQDWSELYEKAKRVNDMVLADRKAAAIRHLTARLDPGERVLDAGCGAGLISADLLERGFSILGVDISSKMLGFAKSNFEKRGFDATRYELSNRDILETQLEAESFGGIAAVGFLQYQTDEARALTEFKRLLRPGGVLVITGPTNRRIANWFGLSRYYFSLRRRLARPKKGRTFTQEEIEEARAKQASKKLLHEISAHSYTYGRFRGLLTDAGFQVQEGRGHGYVNYDVIGPWIGYRGELFLHRFFSAVARVLPIGRWANDIVFVATKPSS